MSARFQIENLSKSYSGPKGGIGAVNEVSLTISAGEFVAVKRSGWHWVAHSRFDPASFVWTNP